MARKTQVARVLALAHALQQSRRGVLLKQYAENNSIPLRTVYRDRDQIEEAGWPLENDGDRYRISATFKLLGAGGIDPEERLALYLARQHAAPLAGTSAGTALDRLWAKVSSESGQGALLPLGGGTVGLNPVFGIDYRPHQATITTLERAIHDRRAVAARYRSPRAEVPTDRVIEPGDLVVEPSNGVLYLVAWCRLRQDIRMFCAHRFLEVQPLEERVPARPETRSRAALRTAFRVWRGENEQRVRIEFSPAVSTEIEERRWHATQQLTPTLRGGVILEMTVSEPLELERWLLGFGPDARVLEPAALAEGVRRRHAEAAASRDAKKQTHDVEAGRSVA